MARRRLTRKKVNDPTVDNALRDIYDKIDGLMPETDGKPSKRPPRAGDTQVVTTDDGIVTDIIYDGKQWLVNVNGNFHPAVNSNGYNTGEGTKGWSKKPIAGESVKYDSNAAVPIVNKKGQNIDIINNDGNLAIDSNIVIGKGDSAGKITSKGDQDLILDTGSTNTGSITITDGDNGDIAINAHGDGKINVDGDVDLSTGSKFKINGTDLAASDIGGITADSSDTLTNKVIDSDNNTITNIVNGDIKGGAGIATDKLSGAVTDIVSNGLGGLAVLDTIDHNKISDFDDEVNALADIKLAAFTGSSNLVTTGNLNATSLQVSGDINQNNTLGVSSYGFFAKASAFVVDGFSVSALVGSFTDTCTFSDSDPTITPDAANTNIKVGQLVKGTGIPTDGNHPYVGAVTDAGSGVTSFELHRDGAPINPSEPSDGGGNTITFDGSTSTAFRVMSNNGASYINFTTSSTSNSWLVGVDSVEGDYSSGFSSPNAPFIISKATAGGTAEEFSNGEKFKLDVNGNMTIPGNFTLDGDITQGSHLSLTSTPGETTTFSVADNSGVFTIATAVSLGDSADIILDSAGDVELNAATGFIKIKQGGTVLASFGSGGDLSLENSINIHKHAYFDSAQSVTGDSTVEINWALGNKAHVTLEDSTSNTITFTGNPDGPCSLTLKLTQNNGSDTISSWSASSGNIKWAGSSAPTLSTGSGDIDIVSFYFDGTDYYGAILKDFG